MTRLQDTEWQEAFKAEHGRPPDDRDGWDRQFSVQVTGLADWAGTSATRQLLYQAGILLKSQEKRGWSMSDVETIYTGVKAMVDALGGPELFRRTVGKTVFKRLDHAYWAIGSGPKSDQPKIFGAAHAAGTIAVYDGVRWDQAQKRWVSSEKAVFDLSTVVHELAHRWGRYHGRALERQFEKATGGSTFLWRYRPGGKPPTGNARWNRNEDLADSIMLYLFPNPEFPLDSPRMDFVSRLFNSPPSREQM